MLEIEPLLLLTIKPTKSVIEENSQLESLKFVLFSNFNTLILLSLSVEEKLSKLQAVKSIKPVLLLNSTNGSLVSIELEVNLA